MQTLAITGIEVPFPEVGDPQLRIIMGAGEVKVTPGATEVWAQGSYDDPSGRLPCHVLTHGPYVEIKQGEHPSDFFGLIDGVPKLDLVLGKDHPYTLALDSGATRTIYDLGGLPITRLSLRQGAGLVELDFSAPNPQPMSAFTFTAGAASIDLRNLANANFADMTIEGGAASYKLDFGGTLRRNANVKVTAGMCSVDVILPPHTAARIISQPTLGTVEANSAFTLRDGAYWTPAGLAGESPLLTITVHVAVGTLRLLTR